MKCYGGTLHGEDTDYKPQGGRLVVAISDPITADFVGTTQDYPVSFPYRIETYVQQTLYRSGEKVLVEESLNTRLHAIEEEARYLISRAKMFEDDGLLRMAAATWDCSRVMERTWWDTFLSGGLDG